MPQVLKVRSETMRDTKRKYKTNLQIMQNYLNLRAKRDLQWWMTTTTTKIESSETAFCASISFFFFSKYSKSLLFILNQPILTFCFQKKKGLIVESGSKSCYFSLPMPCQPVYQAVSKLIQRWKEDDGHTATRVENTDTSLTRRVYASQSHDIICRVML